jgi:methionyl-tRNA synthetase
MRPKVREALPVAKLMKPFYATTPIYYVNDRPHIGHAYSTIATDVLTRHAKVRGRPARFLTGLDEHGLKIERRARELGKEPQAFVDEMAAPFEDAWRALDCRHDDFIRTTEARHKDLAKVFFERMVAAGDVYEGEYEDWYCVGCESFKLERELLEGHVCPDHKKPCERIKEKSYFFRLSKYGPRLLEYYEEHPHFVAPQGRFNEVKSFVSEGLRDLSISRTSFQWGIPVPGAPEHVMYVWLDALTNYVTALGGPAREGESALYDRFWADPEAQIVHIVGKDILRFHAVYWPAFLMSAGLRLPNQIQAHGWLTINGEKMSKSLGNFLPPVPLAEAFGVDVLRYYLMREVGFGQDGDFSHRNLVARYNGELANGLGNLLNRIVPFVDKHFAGVVQPLEQPGELEDELRAAAAKAAVESNRHLEDVLPHRALDAIWELVAVANRYVDRTEPWKLSKAGDEAALARCTTAVIESLAAVSVMAWPFMPGKCDALRGQIGLPPLTPTEGECAWPFQRREPVEGKKVARGEALFPRIDAKAEAELLGRLGVKPAEEAAAAKPQPEKGKGKPKLKDEAPALAEPEGGFIGFEDFAKVDLRLGLVVSAEPVPKSDKLLRLRVDLGEGEPRQIMAGIGDRYPAESMVGRRVVVVANLAPRKLMSLTSQGMVLAVGDGEGFSVLGVDAEIAPGSKVS